MFRKTNFFMLVGLLFYAGCQFPVKKAESTIKADWTLSSFLKVDSLNPILVPASELTFYCPLAQKEVQWEARNVLNPTALVKDEVVYLLYRAQDKWGTSRIGMAVSTDGLHFEKKESPVFYPNQDAMQKYEWDARKNASGVNDNNTFFDGVEDPRIIEREDTTFFMTYTAYDGNTARLCIASSKDLIKWEKHGLVFGETKYADTWSKSGSIIGRLEHNRIIACKIQGKYWMYFGDTDIFLATSDDLMHWEIVEDAEKSHPISVLQPRSGYFDSRLVEPGPAAMLRNDGILLIYNGSNAANYHDETLPKFTYAAGQVLFDKIRPYKLVHRSDRYFIYPDKDYEKVGEVNEVCFVEGLVYFKEKWFLYYGTADTKIAVAVAAE